MQRERTPRRRMRIVLVILAILAVAASAVWIFRAVKSAREKAYLASFGTPAGTVGGYTVPFDLYRAFYLNYRAQMKNSMTDRAALDRAVRARTEEALCGLYGTVSLAATVSLFPTDSDVKVAAAENLDAVKTYYDESAMDFTQKLEKEHMTESVYAYLLTIDALEEKLFLKLKADGAIPTDDAALLDALCADGVLHLSWIWIEDGRGERHEDNRAVAEEALAELKGGAPYALICARYSEDGQMDASGAYLCYGEMPKAAYTAAQGLAEGEYSGVLEETDGYRIVCRLAKDEAYILENFDDLKAAYQSGVLYQKIEGARDGLVFVESDYLRGLSGEDIH